MGSNTTPNAYDVFTFILIIYGLFDASSQVENDVWCLCKNCNQKLEFRKYRIHEKYLVKLS